MDLRKPTLLTIQEFSNLTGLSQRVLRHYHEIGLLIPEFINHKAYRYFGSTNFATAQQILLFKELGFSLKQIKEIIISKEFDKKQALKSQQKILELKKLRLDRILKYIEELLTSGDIEMSHKIKQVFDKKEINAQVDKYAEEAKLKWGKTESYKQSQKRMKQYSKQDIESINQLQSNLYLELAHLMHKPVSDESVQIRVHQARKLITKYWYDCSVEAFAGLGQMYITDERFKQNFEQITKGFTKFYCDAIKYYVDNR